MATDFPGSLDSFTNPTSSDPTNSATVPHAAQHANANDAIEALEAKVGVDSSAVATSHDYKITALEGTAPGTLLTTKGDIIVRTSSAPVRLGVGANNTVLIADSGETGGVKWDEINLANLASALQALLVPTATITPYAGSSAPTGWLLCYGQAISRSTYAGLYAVVGDTYGSGDGSTTFNLPDLRGRTPAGLDNLGGSDAGRLDWANTLGTTGGTQTHTLTGAESGTSAHSHTASSASNGSHNHNVAWAGSAAGGNNKIVEYPAGYNNKTFDDPTYMGSAGAHTHTITVNNSTAANASSAHNNMQPTILLSYIIKV
jgi:microcystin-dependent protein